MSTVNSERIARAVAIAEAEQSNLPPSVLSMEGMSSPKVRHFLSVLVEPDDVFLEVGCWKGSTTVAALHGKTLSPQGDAIVIDNFSEFGGPRAEFLANIGKFIPGVPLRFIDRDCFAAPPSHDNIRGVTVYFYDGGHDVEGHRKAITHFESCLAQECIIIIDDWNMEAAKVGTTQGLSQSRLRVDAMWELPASYNGDVAQWWNGLLVMACTKS